MFWQCLESAEVAAFVAHSIFQFSMMGHRSISLNILSLIRNLAGMNDS